MNNEFATNNIPNDTIRELYNLICYYGENATLKEVLKNELSLGIAKNDNE